jgi:PAS domain S-box-containing protein
MSSTVDRGASAKGEELRTNARLLSLIYDHTSDPVYLVCVEGDGQYRFVSVNECFLRVSGYQVGQVVGVPMERVVPSANVGLVRSQYERAIATRQPVTYEEEAALPAGTRYAEITLIPIFEGSGPVTHILADIRDVTARTIVELEREQLRARIARDGHHPARTAVAEEVDRGWSSGKSGGFPVSSMSSSISATCVLAGCSCTSRRSVSRTSFRRS